MNDAFSVTLGQYESPSQNYRGFEGDVFLPGQLVDIVEGVFGLDNRIVARRLNSSLVNSASALTPLQVAALYNFPQFAATGQCIGLIELGGGYSPEDTSYWFTSMGLATPQVFPVGVNGASTAPGINPDADWEVASDIEVAGAVAQGASLAVYFAPSADELGFIAALDATVGDFLLAPYVVSISWAWSEDSWSSQSIRTFSRALQEMAFLGITVLAASGDNGSDCNIGDGKAHVMYPASDPWVTSCGGTILAPLIQDGMPSWSQGTWNDGAAGGDNIDATGGGVSDVFPLPPWQNGANVPPSANDGKSIGRGVPDIAGNASAYSGYSIRSAGQDQVFGGTSVVAPLYAGLIATLNAQLGVVFPGTTLGYLNPALYSAGNSPVYWPVDDGGNNQWVAEAEPAPFYTAQEAQGSLWNACCGWGSINGTQLWNLFHMASSSLVPQPIAVPGSLAYGTNVIITFTALDPLDNPVPGQAVSVAFQQQSLNASLSVIGHPEPIQGQWTPNTGTFIDTDVNGHVIFIYAAPDGNFAEGHEAEDTGIDTLYVTLSNGNTIDTQYQFYPPTPVPEFFFIPDNLGAADPAAIPETASIQLIEQQAPLPGYPPFTGPPIPEITLQAYNPAAPNGEALGTFAILNLTTNVWEDITTTPKTCIAATYGSQGGMFLTYNEPEPVSSPAGLIDILIATSSTLDGNLACSTQYTITPPGGPPPFIRPPFPVGWHFPIWLEKVIPSVDRVQGSPRSKPGSSPEDE
jgi:kumamolisin